MRKTNHQKHGFTPTTKAFRQVKDFVSVKTFMARLLKEAKWNGRPAKIPLTGEVGRFESIRLIESDKL